MVGVSFLVFFSSRRRHTRCALVTGVQTCALPICRVDARTGLVAAMLFNNEIGAIQPIAEVSAIARRRGALLFCDAVQGFGRVPVPLDACDMVALSSHKVHGDRKSVV